VRLDAGNAEKKIKKDLERIYICMYICIYQNGKKMNTQTQILKALGGNKFLAMTGAVCFANNDTLIVKFKGCSKANIMYVTLTSSDLYDVKICKYKNLDVKPVYQADGVYCDSLRSIFTQVTGLYTSL
jgi:hypothetical protein